MIILTERKRRVEENTKVNPSRWTAGIKNLSLFMYGFLCGIEKKGFWEDGDAPRTYLDLQVITHRNGVVDVLNGNGHFGCSFNLSPSEIALLYKELPRLGIPIGD